MSEQRAEAGSRKRVGQYVLRALRMNPMHEADAIVALRARALGFERDGAAPGPTAPQGQALDRERQLSELATIRAECWSAPPERLLKRIKKLRAVAAPDVRSAAERLGVIAQCRPRLPELTQRREFDGQFFSVLKRVLAESPRETAVVREQALASFRKRKLRRRGRRMIKLLDREMPELYALESGWFESLMSQRAAGLFASGGSSRSDSYTSGSGAERATTAYGCATTFAGIMIIQLILAFLRSCGE